MVIDMPYRKNIFQEGGYYHVYNRGAGKEQIFFNAGNYEYCIYLMARYHDKYGISIIAYCLMPNHYHFLLRQNTTTPISTFINTLFSTYTLAVNRQQKRVGTLFEGRFRHVEVSRDEYFVQLCRYLHLNPVKAKLATNPSGWPYTDYLEWIGSRNMQLGDGALIRQYFSKEDGYEKFVLEYKDELEQNSGINKYLWD
jgi:REP element-mobilizing transposase RayT